MSFQRRSPTVSCSFCGMCSRTTVLASSRSAGLQESIEARIASAAALITLESSVESSVSGVCGCRRPSAMRSSASERARARSFSSTSSTNWSLMAMNDCSSSSMLAPIS